MGAQEPKIPRRRKTDRERRRWHDESFDAMLERIESVEDTAEALSLIPQRVSDLREAVGDLRGAVKDVRDTQGDLREGLDRVERNCAALVESKPDGQGGTQVVPKKLGFDWKILFAVSSTIVVPIVTAIILAP